MPETTPGSWLDGLEEVARATLPDVVFEYVAQGSRDGVARADNLAAWRALRLRPRLLRDVSDVDLRTDLLGAPAAVPWGVAPTSLQRAVHPDGELAMAAATAEAGTVMVVSSNAGTPFADIGRTGVRWWAQTYLPQDRSLAKSLLARAVDAGAEALVLTLDTPVVGTKYNRGPSVWDVVDPEIVRVNFEPGYDEAPGADKALDLGPADVAWLRETTGLPVVAKGVLRGDDALACLDAGASAIWVSNHGGRQLSRALATASALPEVVGAVDGRAPVYVDGGVRTGLDVVLGLALGADAVFLGRQPLFALVGGVDGVRHMHADLREQVVETMRLSGCRTPADVRAGGLVRD